MPTKAPMTDFKSLRLCGLLQLPRELRCQIDGHYLSDLFSGPSDIYYFPEQTDDAHEIPMMRLNRQVFWEMNDFIRSQHTSLYRITSQAAGFDPLTLLSFKARQHRPNFGEIRHLVVEIHPPHPDRPIDMLHIWRRAEKLCEDLRATKQVPRLSVRFMEDDIAAWSTNGIPHQTMGVALWDKDPANCDVSQVIDLLVRLTNITKARITLPSTLTAHEALMGWAEDTEGSMMGLWGMDQETVEETYELLEDDITSSEWVIQNATGRKSKLKFQKLYGENPRLPREEYYAFTEKWPHMDDLSKCERPAYKLYDYDSDLDYW